MSVAPAELALPNPSSAPLISCSSPRSHRVSPFDDLRGVRWRIDLGILPSSSSIDDLRRVAADSRRRYASLRRRLLIDSHFPKDENKAPDLVMDNPLSQNPDSMWGRFFRNAELEKMVDQDLSRLYPEHGSFFQTMACQAMLRRILLLWCLRHPEYGYGQGMHELLAPLLYVLHVDVQRLSQVRELYEDHFTDKFDETCYPQSNQASTHKLKRASSPTSTSWSTGNDDDESNLHGSVTRVSTLDELDPDIRKIYLLTDAYGAEGELGILLSEKFVEHDAYCMFDALMGGARGAVAMADFFSPSPAVGSITGLPPVIEASFALYHLLSTVDPSLHSHLVELGVEPQYFALRWLRVLYGREFLLEDLLIIWDEIFASSNCKSHLSPEDSVSSNFDILRSPRGAYISAMAVSMLLHVRSSLLATENATSCLKRLLNFPENINVKKLIEKANSLQALAFDGSISPSPSPGTIDGSKTAGCRRHSLSFGSISPRTPLNLFPESYWEEKWRVLHKAEEVQKESQCDPLSARIKGSSEKERSGLVRAESTPFSTKTASGKRASRHSVRRRLLEDLTQETGSDSDPEKLGGNGIVVTDVKDPLFVEVDVEKGFLEGQTEQDGIKDFTFATEELSLNGKAVSEDNLSLFSTSTSPLSRANDHENDSEKSSVASNLSIDDNDEGTDNMEDLCSTTISEDQRLQHSEPNEVTQSKLESNTNVVDKQVMALKERKPLSGKFQWLWRFSRNGNSEGNFEKRCNVEAQRPESVGNKGQSTADGCTNSSGYSSGVDTADKNVMGTLRNLGQSMLENIQVIESVFQQDRGKGQVTAVSALKELRKISNLLSEM